jgi:hypothetical protein
LFGNEEVRSARLVMMDEKLSFNSGNMNTFFLGEAYANGGVLCVILAPIIVAIMIYIGYSFFVKLNDNIFTRACLIQLLVRCTPITGGFLDFIYNPNFIIIYLLAVTVSYIGNHVTINKSDTKRKM